MTVLPKQRLQLSPRQRQTWELETIQVTKGHPSSLSQIFVTHCPTLNPGHKPQSAVSRLFQPHLLSDP